MLIPLIIPVSAVMLLLVLLTLSARAAADAAHEKLASLSIRDDPFPQAFNGLVRAAESGIITPDRLDESVLRILKIKGL